ncbi:hypothetical protein CLV28_1900 [Sediminihabitans luteus]|uniref:Uncharacterized protein n=1 Tax=Sediminihabitans luteus TaxID=1138585 RepID=A0A2M9CR59_9CELL|nr:hypothetical protein [Sediminihabitans luteus]PJJ74403.1 hypothetical protein CLV28_1900 [Sediminihabitans luteus]GIJ00230.1 hypothetical protein Slu03_26070 [Sediminihabitans luteus]
MDSHSVRPARSVVLATWIAEVARGAAALTDAVRAVTGDDEPHRVVGGTPPGVGEPESDALAVLVAALTEGDVRTCALLPVPGDASGVPAAVNPSATEAGECVLVAVDDAAWALVPEVTWFGSHLEPGVEVTWACREVDPWHARAFGAVGSLADAERGLRTALVTATEALTHLDVARWREDAAEQIAALRGGELGWPLPPRLDQRRVRALSLATRLRAIVDLATADDGGAVNLWQADQRTAALAQVDRAARHATSAATLTQPGLD